MIPTACWVCGGSGCPECSQTGLQEHCRETPLCSNCVKRNAETTYKGKPICISCEDFLIGLGLDAIR